MSTEGTPATPATPAAQRVDVVFRQEAPAAPAGRPAAEQLPEPVTRVQVGEGDDFRSMTTDAFTERLAEERVRGMNILLKQAGVNKEEREAIVRGLTEQKGAYKVIKASDLEALAKAREESEAAKGKLSKLDAYEARLAKVADAEFAALPEKARERLTAKLPKDADAQTRLDAIEDVKAWIADLAPATPAAPAAGTPAAPATPAAAPVTPPAEPLKPATTLAPPGPTPPKVPGALSVLEQYQALVAKGDRRSAAYFRKEHASEIETALKK